MSSASHPAHDARLDALRELHSSAEQGVDELTRAAARLLDFGLASGDWMWETDAAMRTTWVCGHFEQITGLPPQAVIGQPVADQPLVDAHGDAHPHRRTFAELLARCAPFSRAVTQKQTPRGPLYVSRSAVPVFDSDGRFAGYRGTARDVSAQILALRRSRSHDALLRKLSSQVPGVIFQCRMDTEGRFTYSYASDGLRDIFGVDSPHEVAGPDRSLPLRMLHPDDSAGFIESLRSSAERLTPWQREYRIRRDEGSVRWLETRAAPERLPDGDTLWHGFTADITERKQTELALRRSEERWEMAADAAGIGIAEADLATGVLTLDRRACLNHGLTYPLADYTLDDWLSAIHPDDRAATDQGLRHALAGRSTLETRYRLRRPDGTDATLEVTARGRYDEQGQPRGLVGTCRDVTAQAAIERLRRDKEAAERASQAKSEFLSRVSHELRTPLNGILGFAQLMSLDRLAPLAPEQQRRLDSVIHAGRRLLELIDDVLDLTRIESDDFALRPAWVDAWECLEQCLALLQPLAREAGTHLPPLPAAPRAPCWVKADPSGLEQVLMNLLSNAIKYSRHDGHVAIDVGPAADGTVRIDIRDQGRGISADQRASLFQPFNRLGAQISRTEGSGLGLAISQRLVGAMRGRIEVCSEVGVGTTFTVVLPGGDDAGGPAGPADAPETGPQPLPTNPRRVLYVEDEPLNMVLMEEVFRARPGWTLLMAEDGADGFRIATEGQPDLALIDMNLPDTDGLTLIRRLRADPRTRQLRCIALSADAMSEQIEAAIAAGFDDYWTKPIDVRRVLSDLEKLLA